ncbi:MAG: LuxR C-terminal-related transcriptional regulator [Actinomycetota bacterium]|nr:LuxR C-terminal-related transcriptional regulator [Actinomycetota bacterium]
MLHLLLPLLRPTHRGVGAGLTTRELQVLELLADGTSGPAIAERLYLSGNTVRNHAQNILDKLGVHSRLEAVAVAVHEGIIRRQ